MRLSALRFLAASAFAVMTATPAAMFSLANPQRGAPPLVIPEAKYFTVHVRFTPADGDAAIKAMACHRTQFTPEVMQRIQAASGAMWNGEIACIPANLATRGDDLFR